MNQTDQTRYRRVLISEKQRILENSKKMLQENLNVSPDDLPDEVDLAASEINQGLNFKLRDRERKLLGKIDQALYRIENSSFGICSECEDFIGKKRLEARLVTRLCLPCKEQEERKERNYA